MKEQYIEASRKIGQLLARKQRTDAAITAIGEFKQAVESGFSLPPKYPEGLRSSLQTTKFEARSGVKSHTRLDQIRDEKPYNEALENLELRKELINVAYTSGKIAIRRLKENPNSPKTTIAVEGFNSAVTTSLSPLRKIDERQQEAIKKYEKEKSAKKEQANKQVKRREVPHARETHLDALNLMIDDALATPEEICAKLGVMKNGKPHLRQHAARALRTAIGEIVAHWYIGDVTPEEQALYKKMQHFVRNHGFYSARDMQVLVPRRLEIKSKVQ